MQVGEVVAHLFDTLCGVAVHQKMRNPGIVQCADQPRVNVRTHLVSVVGVVTMVAA